MYSGTTMPHDNRELGIKESFEVWVYRVYPNKGIDWDYYPPRCIGISDSFARAKFLLSNNTGRAGVTGEIIRVTTVRQVYDEEMNETD